LTAKYYIYPGDLATFNVAVFGGDGSTQLFGPHSVTPSSPGWFTVDLSSYSIIVGRDFYVAIQYIAVNFPDIGIDSDDPIDERTYRNGPGSWLLITTYDQMIRAEVDPAPVGGVVYSPDKLAILSPWLVAIGLISAVVIASFIVEKRRI